MLIGLSVSVSINFASLLLHRGRPLAARDHVNLNDCGPQALSAALADHQILVSPERIAALAGTDTAGTTMLGLKRAAEALGVSARGMRLSQAELASYVERGYGVIAFINGDHYVWVKRVQPSGVVVKDVAPGFQLIPHERWHAIWSESKRGKPLLPEEGRGLCLVLSPRN